MKEFPKLIFSDPQEGSELHLEQRFLPLFSFERRSQVATQMFFVLCLNHHSHASVAGVGRIRRQYQQRRDHQESRVFTSKSVFVQYLITNTKKRGQKLLNGKSVAVFQYFPGYIYAHQAKSHYSKSQIFVQKFNFDKTPTFSRVFHPKFFCGNFSREIKVVNS